MRRSELWIPLKLAVSASTPLLGSRRQGNARKCLEVSSGGRTGGQAGLYACPPRLVEQTSIPGSSRASGCRGRGRGERASRARVRLRRRGVSELVASGEELRGRDVGEERLDYLPNSHDRAQRTQVAPQRAGAEERAQAVEAETLVEQRVRRDEPLLLLSGRPRRLPLKSLQRGQERAQEGVPFLTVREMRPRLLAERAEQGGKAAPRAPVQQILTPTVLLGTGARRARCLQEDGKELRMVLLRRR
mmetsp:Transcript_26182/g.83057  ORF Transcript_26182/g.83057 Transcript_26182/m.83057 type:complete len:246 (+) Transcript_26182:61-798(+)